MKTFFTVRHETYNTKKDATFWAGLVEKQLGIKSIPRKHNKEWILAVDQDEQLYAFCMPSARFFRIK